MAPYDARAVANYLLDCADTRGVALTQISLLKIIYFAHGWYLAEKTLPLITNEFEAWERGPVVKVVRDAFKQFKDRAITERAQKLNLWTGEYELVSPHMDSCDAQFILRIFEAYHVFDAWQLSEMTHEPDSPWDKLWNSTEPIGRVGLRIRNEEIKAHFDSLAARLRVS